MATSGTVSDVDKDIFAMTDDELTVLMSIGQYLYFYLYEWGNCLN